MDSEGVPSTKNASLADLGSRLISPSSRYLANGTTTSSTVDGAPAAKVRPPAGIERPWPSPRAASTKEGAAIADADNTVQSSKRSSIRCPSRRLNIRTTNRSFGFSSAATSAACTFFFLVALTDQRERSCALDAGGQQRAGVRRRSDHHLDTQLGHQPNDFGIAVRHHRDGPLVEHRELFQQPYEQRVVATHHHPRWLRAAAGHGRIVASAADASGL